MDNGDQANGASGLERWGARFVVGAVLLVCAVGVSGLVLWNDIGATDVVDTAAAATLAGGAAVAALACAVLALAVDRRARRASAKPGRRVHRGGAAAAAARRRRLRGAGAAHRRPGRGAVWVCVVLVATASGVLGDLWDGGTQDGADGSTESTEAGAAVAVAVAVGIVPWVVLPEPASWIAGPAFAVLLLGGAAVLLARKVLG